MVDCRFNGLDTSLYKVLSWLFRGLIKSELGIRIQKKNVFIALLGREQSIHGLRA